MLKWDKTEKRQEKEEEEQQQEVGEGFNISTVTHSTIWGCDPATSCPTVAARASERIVRSGERGWGVWWGGGGTERGDGFKERQRLEWTENNHTAPSQVCVALSW